LRYIYDANVNSTSKYNCIIPISGGKDSTYQVKKLLKLGIKPLCVSVIPLIMTEVGRSNLNNIRKLGVSVVEKKINYSISKKIIREIFLNIGSILWLEVLSIFVIPIKEALKRDISIIIWGEDPNLDDGYPENAPSIIDLRSWRRKLEGVDVYELSKRVNISLQELSELHIDQDKLIDSRLTGLFLGDYVPWDRLGNAIISQSLGFKGSQESASHSILPYENLDNPFFGIHNYINYLKTGSSNISSICSYLIRRGILCRSDAINIATKMEGIMPDFYMGYSLTKLLSSIDLELSDFQAVCQRVVNKDFFVVNQKNGKINRKNIWPI